MSLAALVLALAAAGSVRPDTTIALDVAARGVVVQDRFLGISIEPSSVVKDPRFSRLDLDVFRVGNCLYRMLELLKPGVIRVGGMRGDELMNKTVDDPTHIDGVLAFARSLGWSIDWQLRFVPSDAEPVLPSLSYLLRQGSDLVRYASIGNEPEWYVGQQKRPEGWGLTGYLTEYGEYLAAVRALCPDLTLLGPEVSGNTDDFAPYLEWIRQFADRFGNDIDALSFHLYPSVAHASPETVEERLRALLSPQTRERVAGVLDDVLAVGRQHALPVYISETNAGIDEPETKGTYDKVASALNVLDLLFLAAQKGIQGACIHLGESTEWVQSPIVCDTATEFCPRCTTRPLFYAMLLFAVADVQQFIGASMTKPQDENVFAYAFLRHDGKIGVALLNKDVDRESSIELAFAPDEARSAFSISLVGDWSGTAATLGQARVYSSGEWTPTWDELAVVDGTARLVLPPASATLVVLGDPPARP